VPPNKRRPVRRAAHSTNQGARIAALEARYLDTSGTDRRQACQEDPQCVVTDDAEMTLHVSDGKPILGNTSH